MMGAQEDITRADALLDADLSGAHVDVQSLAKVYESRKNDRRAALFARALVKRAKATGFEVGSGRGGRVTVDDLKAEIERRNEGRDEADLIVPEGTRKADLEAAIKADDERS